MFKQKGKGKSAPPPRFQDLWEGEEAKGKAGEWDKQAPSHTPLNFLGRGGEGGGDVNIM